MWESMRIWFSHPSNRAMLQVRMRKRERMDMWVINHRIKMLVLASAFPFNDADAGGAKKNYEHRKVRKLNEFIAFVHA
jgi:hypothetical protein